MATSFVSFLFLFYKPELDPSSLPTKVFFSGSLQRLHNWLTMVNFRIFTSLTYLTQIAFVGGNAQTNRSQLMDIVPKREVLYVGGKYTNVTASLGSSLFYAYLTMENRIKQQMSRQWL
jgi:hypothetical protein